MADVRLADLVSPVGGRAGAEVNLPVYSVTKHLGFVASLEYFKKQVFSRDLAAYKVVDPGDFAYATIHLDEGSIGIAPERALISPMYTVFRINSQRVEARYLLRFLKSTRALALYTTMAKGAVHRRKAISLESLGRVLVPLPSIGEQRRIADILDRADALRAKRREALALLDDLTRSIFVDMFSDAEAIPTARLGGLLTFVTSGGRGWAKYYSESGKPFIRSLDVRINAVELADAAYVRPPDNAEARRTEVRSDDTLLTITGSLIGRAAPVPASLGGAYISQHVAILRPNRQRLRSTYLSHFLNLPGGGQRQISAMQYGQTKPGLNFEQIRSFEIPIPPLSAQDAYVERVERIACIRQTAQAQLDCHNHLSASLQQRAFAGQL